MLELELRHDFAAFSLDLQFCSGPGITALYGASGAGKTSIVRMIAGLLRPQRGRVRVNGRWLTDSERGLHIPPHRRRIGCVFQDARLFPHLTVRQNLLYGRWFAHARGASSGVSEVVALLGLQALLERAPARLSGGERQRVALGRALLAAPQLLLLDEPLASIDQPRRAEILPYLEGLRDQMGVPMVYVSHSLVEVARLANHVVRIEGGRVLAQGEPVSTLMADAQRPAFENAEAGSLLAVEVDAHLDAAGLSRLRCAAGHLYLPRLQRAPGSTLRLWIRARDVMLALQPLHGVSALNLLPVTVVSLHAGNACSLNVALDCHGDRLWATVTRLSAERLQLRPGLQLQAVIKSASFEPSSLPA